MQSDTPRKRGKPFEAGNQFGKGRAEGSRNKVTLALEQLLEGDAPAITRKMIQLAKKGDPTSIRLCMDRVYPVRRERQLKLDLPEIHTADDVTAAFRAVIQSLAQGDITTDQAERISRLLEFGRKSIETENLARGLREIRVELQEMKENYGQRAA
jgi:hypothetical protein